MKATIAVVILTRDEPEFLDKTVRGIIERTSYPYELFIVDNNSSSSLQIELLNKYKKQGLAQVIFNTKNQWVLGFNKALEIVDKREGLSKEYIVLSDGDIVVPEPKDNLCWLEYMKQKLDCNVAVGKLGLALNLEFIKNQKYLNTVYENELAYMEGPLIGDLVVAAVDTTLAMYRKDLFVMNKFKMLPGHASLVKPHYYTCRTTGHYQAEHLGWSLYNELDKKQLQEKVICFTKYGGCIIPILLNQTSTKAKYFYKIFRHIYRLYWFVILSIYWAYYIALRFPRNLNEIQSKNRGQ